MQSMIRFFAAAFLGLLATAANAQLNSSQVFKPVGNDYAWGATTSCTTPAQLPAIGAPAAYPLVTVALVNINASLVPAYVLWGPTSASVSSPTIATAGSGTFGTAGNTSVILPAGLFLSVPDGSWFCIVTASNTTTVHVQAGYGH